jgi:hypothetical protein
MSPPQPYQFQFDVNDDENTNYQNRKEQREGNKISGSYSVVDSDGFIRTVTYTADPVEVRIKKIFNVTIFSSTTPGVFFFFF